MEQMNSLDCYESKVGNLDIHVERGELFYATSPQIKGMFVAGKSVDEVKEEIPSVLFDMLKAMQFELSEVIRERDMLAEALRFYANAYAMTVTYSNYPDDRSYDVVEDGGQHASCVMAKLRK